MKKFQINNSWDSIPFGHGVMKFCKIVIVPGLDQLSQLSLCHRNTQIVLQKTVVALKTGDMIHVDQDPAAD